MPPTHKPISHIVWILLAITLGVCLSYLGLKGIRHALGDASSQQDEAFVAQIPTPKIKPVTAKSSQDYFSIGFVGDIMPGVHAYDNIFSDVSFYTKKPDLMLANLEGVITSHIYSKCKVDSENCFAFNGDPKFLRLLKEASFDVLNLANNHFNDFGEVGQNDTVAEILKAKIIPSGLKNKVTYVTKNGFTVGIIGVSNYWYTTNMESTKTIDKIIREADQNAHLVVVYFHAGGEGVEYDRVPYGIEWYLGENRGDLRTFSKSAIDSGADIVVGSGPHVLRGMEIYKNKLIAYSLGNFASANSVSTLGALKISALLETTFDKDGNLSSGKIYPFEIDWQGSPNPDPKLTAIENINRLSQEDFGDNGIKLSESGEIILK